MRSGEQSPAPPTESELVLREFFPEVWLFEDYQFGASGKKELHLKTPHSVTEWRFAAKFWSSRRADVCRVPSESLLVQKDGNAFINYALKCSGFCLKFSWKLTCSRTFT